MTSSELYTLKYDIKRALAEQQDDNNPTPDSTSTSTGKKASSLTLTDRAKLRQIQKEVTWIGQAFWLYSFCDLSYSFTSLYRGFKSNRFVLQKMAQKTVLVCTIRLFLMYEASQYLASQHMFKNAKPILKRKMHDPRKAELLTKMN